MGKNEKNYNKIMAINRTISYMTGQGINFFPRLKYFLSGRDATIKIVLGGGKLVHHHKP